MMLLYAGNNLDKARRIFERAHKNRPRIRLTIRQRSNATRQSAPSCSSDSVDNVDSAT